MKVFLVILMASISTAITFFLMVSLYQVQRIKKWNKNFSDSAEKKTGKYFTKLSHLKVYQWHFERLEKSGESEQDAHVRARIWLGAVFTIGLLAQIVMPFGIFSGVLAVGILWVSFFAVTHQRIKAREISFATGVYKIYRYLALQITAGLRVTDTLKHLHEASNQPFLKEAMYAYSTRYFQTMDLDRATEELTKRINGQDVQILTAILKQGITTGDHYEMLKKQEKLMIRRYYSALEAETESIKRRGIFIAISLCLIVFLILALPMVYEMSRATRSIFSY